MRSLDVLSPEVKGDNSPQVNEVNENKFLGELTTALTEIIDKQNDATSDIVKRFESVIKTQLETKKEPEVIEPEE